MGRVFNFKCVACSCIPCNFAHNKNKPNLKLKTWPKQLFGSLLLAFALSEQIHIAFKTGFFSFPKLLGD